MELRTVTDSAWDSWLVGESPFGIEKISSRDFVIFRMWGSNRVYLREEPFISRKQAHDYLVPMIEKYNSSIITALVEA